MDRWAAVLITLILYQLILVGIGLACRRRTHDNLDFFLGGRALGPVVASISASASSSSAWTLLGVSGAAYAWGLSALWLFPSCVGGFLLNWFVLAPRLQRLSHRTGALTVTEILAGPPEQRFHGAINKVASLIVIVSLGAYVAAQFQGAGKTFSETFGLSMTTSILIGSGVVVLYTLLGGFWAVSVTDTLQGLLMALAAVLIPLTALHQVGGFGALIEGMRQVPVAGYLSLTREFPLIGGLGFVAGLLGIGLGYPGQPHVVNRFMAMRDTPGAMARARRIAILWAVIVYGGMLLLGFCGRVLFPLLADPEVVFVSSANGLFHPVVSGILIAAVLSAIMSTADSQLLVAASALSHDLKLGGLSHRSLLLRSRVFVLLLSAGAVLTALVGSQVIFSRVLFAWAAMGAAFGPLLLLILYRGRILPGRRLAAIVAGFLASVTAYYAVTGVWSGAWERVIPFLIALLIAWTGSRTPPKTQTQIPL